MSININGNAATIQRSPIPDQVLVLLEEVAQANRQLNAQNQSLREYLKKRDTENKAALEKLERKLDDAVGSSSENGSPRGLNKKRIRTRKRVRVPAQCRVR